MFCNQCASFNCVHMQIRMGSVNVSQQQQQMLKLYNDYGSSQMANFLGQEMAKAYVEKSSKKKLLLIRK